MNIRWSSRAANEYRALLAYIANENPVAATRVGDILWNTVESLAVFPRRGRVGSVPGTRELPIPGLPYIIVYRLEEDTVGIARILHGAQRYP
jgi:toxin ParE1/3/4